MLGNGKDGMALSVVALQATNAIVEASVCSGSASNRRHHGSEIPVKTIWQKQNSLPFDDNGRSSVHHCPQGPYLLTASQSPRGSCLAPLSAAARGHQSRIMNMLWRPPVAVARRHHC
jgi:hypothetical protein